MLKNQLPGLNYTFSKPERLQLALTHRSYGSVNNERLEFLGDAIVGMVVAEILYQLHPDLPEGALTRLRAGVVRGETLADIAIGMDLSSHVRIGNAEKKSGTSRRRSILADTLEAVLAAVYLDGGYPEVVRVITELTRETIASLPDPEDLKDPKTRLQEWLQARGREVPEYKIISESGADHAKEFVVECRLTDDAISFNAAGSSRRKAQQAAAVQMLARLLQV